MAEPASIPKTLRGRLNPWRRLTMMSMVLTCASLAFGSLWLVESGVKDLDERLELRRQALWSFESLRQRVARYPNRRRDELAAEREEIEFAYALVVRDWQRESPVAGLRPVLRKSAEHLELVFAPIDDEQDGGRGR